MHDMHLDILGLGVAVVDDIVTVDHFPRPNEKQRILRRQRQLGGLTATALAAAARLGVRCGYCITLGEDDLSGYIRTALIDAGISLLERGADPKCLPYHNIIITEEKTGERSVLSDKSLAQPPKIGRMELALIPSMKCLYVDHVWAAHLLDAAREARRCGVPVVGDYERASDGGSDLMDLTDHLILPLSYAQSVLGANTDPESAVQTLARRPGRALACVTDGERGCWYALGSTPDVVHHQPAVRMDCVVDTTGCGDVFHGVYAAGLVLGWPPPQRIRMAAAAAALKTRRPGAIGGAPNLDELVNFIH